MKRLLLILSLLLVAGACLGATQEYKSPMTGSFAPTGAQTAALDSTSAYATTFLIDLRERQTITFFTKFSSSTATGTLLFVRGWKDESGGFHAIGSTATPIAATTTPTNASLYEGSSASFDTAGLEWGKVSVRVISTGTVGADWSVH